MVRLKRNPIDVEAEKDAKIRALEEQVKHLYTIISASEKENLMLLEYIHNKLWEWCADAPSFVNIIVDERKKHDDKDSKTETERFSAASVSGDSGQDKRVFRRYQRLDAEEATGKAGSRKRKRNGVDKRVS